MWLCCSYFLLFNLYFSLQADVSTAGTSCSSFIFVMLPVNDHHSWSSWKVWQMLNQVLMGDFSAYDSSSSMKMWGGGNAWWEKGEAEGCLLWLCDYWWIPWELRGVQSYHPHTHWLCSLRCTEIQPLLEAVSYKMIYIFLFFCFKIFGGGEQTWRL